MDRLLWAIGIAYIVLLCALTLRVNFRGEPMPPLAWNRRRLRHWIGALALAPMRRTAIILVADMLLGYAYSFTFGGGIDYSLYMIGVNAIACYLVTEEKAGRWQSLIGWSFILQIGTDTGRVVSELKFGISDMIFVYWATTVLAYIQLLLLTGWWVNERAGYSSEFAPDPPARQARDPGLA